MCGADTRAAANTAPKYPESKLRARGLVNKVTKDDESSCISNFQNRRLKAMREMRQAGSNVLTQRHSTWDRGKLH